MFDDELARPFVAIGRDDHPAAGHGVFAKLRQGVDASVYRESVRDDFDRRSVRASPD
jgi:hypothetical protein